ncbi:winged helix-turn-helix domain-containing protein [Streptomyces sp. NPDC087901]|uniref:helix-turn-helix domain-containing protein n=1 Tax=Streptomyces sp. NPDC087901 TaxID=3365818 RepID=UPI003823EE78
MLEEELGKGPVPHGFEDEPWTLVRVQASNPRRLRVSLSVATVWRLLRVHGWSWQAPAWTALERDEHAVELWKKEVWPRVLGLRRLPLAPGSSSRTGQLLDAPPVTVFVAPQWGLRPSGPA